MYLKRFYDEKLAQASYLVGCAATGEALVVDANRMIEQYIEDATAQGLRITHVTETHIHADYVSGSRELAARTGAKLFLSDEGGPDWKYAFAAEAGATLLKDGDSFKVGNIRIEALHTPGHTPEHLAFMVTDTAGADRPMGVFTGDFVFVGDVGRPDLLERAAKYEGTMVAGARTLFKSLQQFKQQPDYLQVWPGHGAGSACGKALGAVPQTTVGYEKQFNWAFAYDDEAGFVAAVLAGQPEPPRYFAEMKRINRDGPRLLGDYQRPVRMSGAQFIEAMAAKAVVIDVRSAAEYANAHVPGTINIPLSKAFTTWAGWLTSYDRDFYLLVPAAQVGSTVDAAVRDLAMIGLDRVAGYFTEDSLDAWRVAGRELASTTQIGVDELKQQLAAGAVNVLDVRGRTEWDAGHIASDAAANGSRVVHIPLGYLTERLDELPRDKPIVVHCQAGARSAIAASVLEASGVQNVIDLRGGFQQWRAA